MKALELAGMAQAIVFEGPVKALYASKPVWTTTRSNPPFMIDDDAAFVLGTQPYRLLPYDKFLYSIYELSKVGIEIKPNDLKEGIDYDPTETSDVTYALLNNTLLRFRCDSSSHQDRVIHTLSILGRIDDIVKTAELISLPHPFDDAKYPYRVLFCDPRANPLRVLRKI